MSANNQNLVLEKDGKYYVFLDVMAESWDEVNKIDKSEAKAVFDSFEAAYKYSLANDMDTEYGTSGRLVKDGALVFFEE